MARESVTWRPGGARVVAYGVAACLVAMTIGIGYALPDDITFTVAELATLALILLVTIGLLHGVGRSRVTADATGVHVLNGYRRHEVPWGDIAGFSMNRGAPWPTLVTHDDARVMLFAIQGSDGPVARAAVEELTRRLGDAQ